MNPTLSSPTPGPPSWTVSQSLKHLIALYISFYRSHLFLFARSMQRVGLPAILGLKFHRHQTPSVMVYRLTTGRIASSNACELCIRHQ